MVFSECKEWKIDDVEMLIDRILKHTILCFALWPNGCFYTWSLQKQIGNSCQYELNETHPSFVNAVTFMSMLFEADANFFP